MKASWDQIAMELASPDFPGDILIDILSRLPAKSIMRFLCVHKSWYCLFKNPTFVAFHFHRPAGYLAISYNYNYRNIHLISAETYKRCGAISIPWKNNMRSLVVAHCNGIFCVELDCGKYTFVYNPALKQSKEIVAPKEVSPPNASKSYAKGRRLGYGFDSENNDYKYVKIREYFVENPRRTYSRADIYSLNRESWEARETVVDGFVHARLTSSALVNNALHWRATREVQNGPKSPMIVTFDLVNGEFGETIMLPNSRVDERRNWEFVAFKDSLAIIVTFVEGAKNFDMWWMREYGVFKSWTKIHSIKSHFTIEKVIGLMDNDTILFLGYDETESAEERDRLLVFDSGFLQITPLLMHGIKDDPLANIMHYKESLEAVHRKIKKKKVMRKSDFRWLIFLSSIFVALVAFLFAGFL